MIDLAVLMLFLGLCAWMGGFNKGGVLTVNAEEAIAVLLEAGAAVECRRWHVSRKQDGSYLLLNFNDDGDLLADKDECFTDLGDAVAKFLLRTRL